ncbi:uncharacterized protein LOC111303594 [Durio zibethinus]|uniref:Uncharacterized protein LOC111303594 n=1 Tax=Durio zibethinus TaxID=66656 RepID=A0A6P5ZT33_DURZI|nr:uncharacterized protein LOC111303594 [Durio zibethinus]
MDVMHVETVEVMVSDLSDSKKGDGNPLANWIRIAISTSTPLETFYLSLRQQAGPNRFICEHLIQLWASILAEYFVRQDLLELTESIHHTSAKMQQSVPKPSGSGLPKLREEEEWADNGDLFNG